MTHTPEDIARGVIDRCADCDVCRHLMDVNCLLFPELFRLFDGEKEEGKIIGRDEFKSMIDLCNFCALCPCPNIRSEIMQAKAAFVEQDGLKSSVRLLEDVALVGKICGALPGLTNRLLDNPLSGKPIKRGLGIHPDRKLPAFPGESFTAWAKKQGLHKKDQDPKSRKVAYFAGCTAIYLFPQVAQAAVRFLQKSGITVWFPPQQCCGMPAYLEGDTRLALKFAQANLEQLCTAVDEGYDIVSSCPTCGFMFRDLLKSGAYYATEYQAAVGAPLDMILKPENEQSTDGTPRFSQFKKSIYGKILKDDGMFASISALKRVKVAEHFFDLGEYISKLGKGTKDVDSPGDTGGNIVYFAPCHQRELNIGRPYLKLLTEVYGERVSSIDGNLYCCGMAGIMGFKKDVHEKSRKLGQNLMDVLEEKAPDLIVTDCLSCRLQFEQFTPYAVRHPIELLL
jgi:glycerol-3-phosphate dehydrogenase subunit C